ncbi:hypothetical protein [Rivihabitans pingtungensis]|uniref:hypothetical protein n=1 Tax=Rivihabitans pingtungensis TaxID=1054498 RepID=UPI00235401B7|nr:hypothetical protein [Rivihabitans pingtungensis]MCK6435386.1 hypothetical protein [Rivihabitans pingtungensis]
MKRYTPNSPQAIARILCMFMMGDGVMDPRELDSFDRLDLLSLLGLERKAFLALFHDYCNDISDEAEPDGSIHLVDRARADLVLDEVTDHQKRLLTCAIALDLCKADDTISEPEMALLQYMMAKWHITLDTLEEQFIRQ